MTAASASSICEVRRSAAVCTSCSARDSCLGVGLMLLLLTKIYPACQNREIFRRGDERITHPSPTRSGNRKFTVKACGLIETALYHQHAPCDKRRQRVKAKRKRVKGKSVRANYACEFCSLTFAFYPFYVRLLLSLLYPARSAHVRAQSRAVSTPCVRKLRASAARPRRSSKTCRSTCQAPRVAAPALQEST